MKIKYQIILLLTAMVMLFGGCGKKNTVVTGRYYYPDQEKDAKTEETSDDADESAETTEKNEAVIGSDQFLIKTNDMQEECLTLEQIDEMDKWEGSQLNQAKEILAFELTKLVHGEEEANKAKEASHALFAGGGDSAHMPTLELTAADFADGDLDILALLVKAELAPSRSDARRAVQQGGVSVADEKVTDIQTTYGADAFGADGLVVKRGKKKFVKIVLK